MPNDPSAPSFVNPSSVSPSSADPSSLATLSDAVARVVADAAPGVVAVHSHRARSSGFVWRSGLVVTADEALAEEGEVSVVLPGGRSSPATLVGRDPTTDVALLRVEAPGLTPVALEPAPAQVGALAVAVGSQDGAPLAAFGIVAFAGPAWRSLRGGEIDTRIELDLSLRRRAEGGLALDASGRALGMAVFGPRRRVLVIPAATLDRVAAALQAHGRVARGYLGLGLQPVRVEAGAGDGTGFGAMVMSVDPDGPAASAGVRQGDVIVAWDGRPVRHVPSLLRALGPASVGASVRLALIRAGERTERSLTVGERPAA